MRERDTEDTLWKPDPRTIRLIEWSLAGEPESEPLPDGAAEILASRRRTDLFETWEAVSKFGPSAAEPLRQAYGFPEELNYRPEGLVTEVQAPRFADGIAEMLLSEPRIIGRDSRGFAISDGIHWSEREWATRDDLRRYLFLEARNRLWKKMHIEDRQSASVIRHALSAGPRNPSRMELLADVENCLSPIRRLMPELHRYFRILNAAADPQTGEVDLEIVARRYGVSRDRVEESLGIILRQFAPELEKFSLQLSL